MLRNTEGRYGQEPEGGCGPVHLLGVRDCALLRTAELEVPQVPIRLRFRGSCQVLEVFPKVLPRSSASGFSYNESASAVKIGETPGVVWAPPGDAASNELAARRDASWDKGGRASDGAPKRACCLSTRSFLGDNPP